MDRFGDRLAELRQDRQLRQKDIADYLHVSCGTISNYECGNHDPDIDTLVKLASYFNVSLDYLVGVTKSKIPIACFAANYVENLSLAELLDQILQLNDEHRRVIATTVAAFAFKEMVQNQKRSGL